MTQKNSTEITDEIKLMLREPATRITLLPRDTNAHGTIFGGIILSYIDIAGATGAHRLGIERVVTVAMNSIVFHEPVFVGDIISFYAWPVRLGKTSISIRVTVTAERINSLNTIYEDRILPKRIKVTEAETVFVAIDENRKPRHIIKEKEWIETVIKYFANNSN